MQITYKRSPNVSHMIIETEEVMAYYANRMLKENTIPGLLSFSESGSGGKVSYWFDITAKKSLHGFFSQEGISKTTVYSFIKSLKECIDSMGQYLLDPNSLILSADTVFVKNDGTGGKAYFACLPVRKNGFAEGFLSVMDFLIRNVDHKNPEAVKLCYGLYEMAEKGETSLGEYLAFLDSCTTTYTEERIILHEDTFAEEARSRSELIESIWEDIPEEEPKRGGILTAIEKIKGMNITEYIKPVKKKKKEKKGRICPKMDYEDFILDPISDEEETYGTTVVLHGDKIYDRRLVYIGRGVHQDMIIDSNPFNIGSREADNDAVIKETVISRCHARISMTDGDYYLEDLESKNGTYLNGRILGFNSKEKLNIGDRISFANIGYRFE